MYMFMKVFTSKVLVNSKPRKSSVLERSPTALARPISVKQHELKEIAEWRTSELVLKPFTCQ